jgi:hypothetical protein
LLRRAIIGVAPILVGLAVIFSMLSYFQTGASHNLLIDVFIFYVIFEVGNTLFSSRKDLEGSLEFLAAGLVLAVAVFVIKPEIFHNLLWFFQRKEIINLFKNADLFLIAPILIDLIVVFITRLFIG